VSRRASRGGLNIGSLLLTRMDSATTAHARRTGSRAISTDILHFSARVLVNHGARVD